MAAPREKGGATDQAIGMQAHYWPPFHNIPYPRGSWPTGMPMATKTSVNTPWPPYNMTNIREVEFTSLTSESAEGGTQAKAAKFTMTTEMQNIREVLGYK